MAEYLTDSFFHIKYSNKTHVTSLVVYSKFHREKSRISLTLQTGSLETFACGYTHINVTTWCKFRGSRGEPIELINQHDFQITS